MNKRPENTEAKPRPNQKRDLHSDMKSTLSGHQRRLIKALPMAKSTAEAGRIAGYADRAATARGLKNLQQKAPEICRELGLDLTTVINDCLRPGLYAKETKFFAHEGKVVDTREVIAWGERHKYLDTYFKITGSYQHPDDGARRDTAGAITINLSLVSPGEARAILAAIEVDRGPAVLADENDQDEGRAGSGESV